MSHQEIKELLPFAAMDRLEAEEARILEEHLRTGCAECEVELREFRETLAALALGLHPTGSEQQIWQRLEVRLHQAAPATAPTAPAAPLAGEPASPHPVKSEVDNSMRPGRRSRNEVRAWRLASAGLAVALVIISISADRANSRLHRLEAQNRQQMASVDSRIHRLRGQLDTAYRQVRVVQGVLADRIRLERVLTAPDLQLTRLEPLKPAPDSRAIVAVSTANHTAMIQAEGLPPTPAGKTYELWWITKEQGPLEAGLFKVENGAPVIAPAAPPPSGQTVEVSAVTIEPAGGVAKPTGAMYLKSSSIE